MCKEGNKMYRLFSFAGVKGSMRGPSSNPLGSVWNPESTEERK